MDETYDIFALLSWKLILGVIVLMGLKILCICRVLPECLGEHTSTLAVERERLAVDQHVTGVEGSTCTVNMEMQEQLKKELLQDCLAAENVKPSTTRPVPSISHCGTCCICWEDYQGKISDIRLGYLPHCQHFYHFDCIWQWLQKQDTCPLCRKETQLTAVDIRAMTLRQVLQSHDTLSQDIQIDLSQLPKRLREFT